MFKGQPDLLALADAAKSYMDEQADAGRDVPWAQVAGFVDVSPFRLFRAFCRRFGETPRAYLRRKLGRVNLARRGAAGLTNMERQALVMAGLRLPACPEVAAAHDGLILRGLAIRACTGRLDTLAVLLTVEGQQSRGRIASAEVRPQNENDDDDTNLREDK